MNEHSAAAMYGRGLFTTMRIAGGKPWLWDKHWLRLESGAKTLGIDLESFPEQKVRQRLSDQLASDSMREGRARITFHDNRSSDMWPGEIVEEKTTISVVTGPPRQIATPFRCGISPYAVNSTSPLAGLKTCNYLEQIISLEEAKKRGFDEAIRINERGHVTSACMANVFWLKEDRLFTPALTTGCLPGTTREFVTENLEVAEVAAGQSEFVEADAVILTSAGLGAVWVAEFDGRQMPIVNHELLELVQKAEAPA